MHSIFVQFPGQPVRRLGQTTTQLNARRHAIKAAVILADASKAGVIFVADDQDLAYRKYYVDVLGNVHAVNLGTERQWLGAASHLEKVVTLANLATAAQILNNFA